MLATALPSDVKALHPRSTEPVAVEAFARCKRPLPPLLFVKLPEMEVQDRHPYQEAFEHTVALALLAERSTDPETLIVAAEEAWVADYGGALEMWHEAPSNSPSKLFRNAMTGEQSTADPRRQLLREMQIGCRLMAMLRTKLVH
eukprot:gnl/TRDRNA2_/TRDRNA2_174018_c12_seq1.p1 gnl/TRDRNA2_/TRDRNA2_174018_c12~~gnl/TRDRNA2_/TRDRNA2_174018_c12_seq1.p1  ORF type:complete len:144 (+),score=30.15 gnl/TRDRNA2_/TRDRNA2_174018_c12_seq1:3-434(+)